MFISELFMAFRTEKSVVEAAIILGKSLNTAILVQNQALSSLLKVEPSQITKATPPQVQIIYLLIKANC